jgi:precorrin-2 methylase
MGSHRPFAWTGLKIFLISTSQIAGITGVSHCASKTGLFLEKLDSKWSSKKGRPVR